MPRNFFCRLKEYIVMQQMKKCVFYLPFRIGFPTTVGENKVYSNETHNGQDCETEVVGAVEDDRDEEVEVARLPALRHRCGLVLCSAPTVPQPVFTITEKAPTRAFSWLKAPTSAFTFKKLLRHCAKRALTPR